MGVAPPPPYANGRHDPPLLFDLEADPGENAPLASGSPEYRAAMKTIGAARGKHLATVTPVPDQNGRGSDSQFRLCSRPGTAPHNCTMDPGNWRPQEVCRSEACLKANPTFAARCKHKD